MDQGPVGGPVGPGFGAPVVSTIEDVVSVAMSLVAIILPVLVLVFVVLLFVAFWWMMRRRKRRKEEKAAARWAQSQGYRPT